MRTKPICPLISHPYIQTELKRSVLHPFECEGDGRIQRRMQPSPKHEERAQDAPLSLQTKPSRRVAGCVLSSARATGAYIDVCNRARDTKKGRTMRPYLCRPNRAEGLQVAFFQVRGRRAHTLTYVTEPETRRKGARCALILGLAEREGFAPLAQQLLCLAQPRLGIFVPSKSISETCETVKCRSEVFCAREREILSEFRG